jgi:hypothetical protein
MKRQPMVGMRRSPEVVRVAVEGLLLRECCNGGRPGAFADLIVSLFTPV